MEDSFEAMRKDLFNLDLICNFDPKTKFLKEITTTKTMETSSNVFNKEGLFSNEIFGLPGTPIRSTQLSYVKLHIPVLHPLVYQQYCKVRAMYKDIMDSKVYVVFNESLKDFEITDQEQGYTGYDYFINHIDKLKLDDRDSDRRKIKLDLIQKYGKTNSLLNYWLIMPAGLRDYSLDENGRPNENEINTLYRKLISTCSMLTNFKITSKDYYLYDKIRIRIQNILLEIYEYIINMLDGKSKFIQGKWAKRSVMYGTRNVISPFIPNVTHLEEPTISNMNYTIIGLYQYLKGCLPITVNRFINNISNRIFTNDVSEAKVIDKETKKFIYKNIDIKTKESWMSLDGVNDLLEKLRYEDTINKYVDIDGNYLFLIYDDRISGNIYIIRDEDDLNKIGNINQDYLQPITYGQLFYISCLDIMNKYPGFLTRYPVTGLGSIYPSYSYVKTTVKGRKVNIIDKMVTTLVYEYPDMNQKWFRSMSPNSNKIGGLGADYDGKKTA